MKKTQLYLTFTMVFALMYAFTIQTHAQGGSVLYNTVSGTVWNDQNANGMMDPVNSNAVLRIAEENPIKGVLVKLVTDDYEVTIASAISKADGSYELKNYVGAGDYIIVFEFPETAFEYPNGGDDYEYPVSINDNTNLTQNIGLTRKTGVFYSDGMIDFQSTNWSEDITLSQFPFYFLAPDVSMIGSPLIWVSQATHNPTIQVSNPTDIPQGVTILGIGGSISNSSPGIPGTSGRFDLSSEFKVENLTVDGGKFVSYDNFYSGESLFKSTTVAGRALYNGSTGTTIDIPFNVYATSSTVGAGNLETSFTTEVAVGAIVVYRFDMDEEDLKDMIILPVQLTGFEAKAVTGQTVLKWTSVTENNSKGFEVERSADGKTFTTIAFVATTAQNGISASTITYQAIDENPGIGVNIYRIKLVDLDGHYSYSDLRSVKFTDFELARISIFPNPATHNLKIAAPVKSIVNIIDGSGRSVAGDIIVQNPTMNINVSHLPNGNYYIRIVNDDQLKIEKLTIRR